MKKKNAYLPMNLTSTSATIHEGICGRAHQVGDKNTYPMDIHHHHSIPT